MLPSGCFVSTAPHHGQVHHPHLHRSQIATVLVSAFDNNTLVRTALISYTPSMSTSSSSSLVDRLVSGTGTAITKIYESVSAN